MHADEVICVHHSVNESIEQNGEEDITIIHDIGIEPVEEKNSEVMVDMQKRKLTPFLSQYNEDCVPEVPHLGDVEKPEKVFEGWVFHEEVIAWDGGVSVSVREEPSLYCHVRTKEDLRDVVKEFDGVRVHGGEGFHNGRSDYYEGEVDKRHGDGTFEVTEPPSLFCCVLRSMKNLSMTITGVAKREHQ